MVSAFSSLQVAAPAGRSKPRMPIPPSQLIIDPVALLEFFVLGQQPVMPGVIGCLRDAPPAASGSGPSAARGNGERMKRTGEICARRGSPLGYAELRGWTTLASVCDIVTVCVSRTTERDDSRFASIRGTRHER